MRLIGSVMARYVSSSVDVTQHLHSISFTRRESPQPLRAASHIGTEAAVAATVRRPSRGEVAREGSCQASAPVLVTSR